MRPLQARAAPVSAWFREIDRETVFTTAISVAETLAGIEILPQGRRRSELAAAAERIFGELFEGRILPFDFGAARAFALAAAGRRRQGRHSDPLDLQIAGIAIANRMAIATRNTRDFEGTGVALIDPWTA